MTERLKTAISAGGTVALFPVLKDWSTEDLKALVDDCDAYYQEAHAAIEGARQSAMFTPAVFFSDGNFEDLHRKADDGDMEVFSVCAEISSVALFWLEQRGVDIEVEEA